MIVPKNIRPEKSLYAIGATVISVLKKREVIEFDPEIVYRDFSSLYPIKISYNYFLYALDWLFLIGLINLNEKKNRIKRCF